MTWNWIKLRSECTDRINNRELGHGDICRRGGQSYSSPGPPRPTSATVDAWPLTQMIGMVVAVPTWRPHGELPELKLREFTFLWLGKTSTPQGFETVTSCILDRKNRCETRHSTDSIIKYKALKTSPLALLTRFVTLNDVQLDLLYASQQWVTILSSLYNYVNFVKLKLQ